MINVDDYYEIPMCLCGTKLVPIVKIPQLPASVQSGGKLGMIKINPNSNNCIVTHLACGRKIYPKQHEFTCNNEYEVKRDLKGRIARGNRL